MAKIIKMTMNQCLEKSKISWFYGIDGSLNDEKYIKFYQLLLDYQDAFIFDKTDNLIKIKLEINQLSENKRFINLIKLFDENNEKYFNKKQEDSNFKTTMNMIMKKHNYNMYLEINNKRHADNRNNLITRLFIYEQEYLLGHDVIDSEVEMDILTMSTNLKYHNFLRDFKRSNEIDFISKEKIFNLIKDDLVYKLVTDKLVTGLLETKNKLTSIVQEGYLLAYNPLNNLVSNKKYQNKEQLIIDCKLWIYALEHELLLDSEEDYYIASEDHYNRNEYAITKISYLESEFLFNKESLSLVPKFILKDLTNNIDINKLPELKRLILNLF